MDDVRFSLTDVLDAVFSVAVDDRDRLDPTTSCVVLTGSHHESINLVLNNVVDAAAIDSNALRYWNDDHPKQKDELHVLCSWGPWPIQPIVINARLPADTKRQITEALLKAVEHVEYGPRFLKYGLVGFKHVDPAFYERVREAVEQSKNEKLYPAYY